MVVSPIRVGIIGSKGYPYTFSGYETLLSAIIPFLEHRFELHIYCHRGLFRERPRQVGGVRLHYIPAIPNASMCQLSNSGLALLHALWSGLDVLLFLNIANTPWGWIASRLGRRTVVNTDGLEWKRPLWRGAGAIYYRWAARNAGRSFGKVICDSIEMKRIYQTEFGVPEEAIRTITYAASGRLSDGSARISALGLTEGGYYLAVGRLVPDNNLDLVIEAFLASGAGRRLVLVGDVLFQNEFSRRVKSVSSERILQLGFVRDNILLSELYSCSRAYVHAHEFGGTNPTLLEALAHGCACCVLDTPFARETVRENGALLFGKSVGQLAAAFRILEESDDRIAELRSGARAVHAARESWEEIAERYAAVISEP